LLTGSGGDFEFSIDGEQVYSKRGTGVYPEMGALKSAVVAAIEAKAELPPRSPTS
jgi:predicted Rdx family selenoprotein